MASLLCTTDRSTDTVGQKKEEDKKAMIARVLNRGVSRTKERVLQNLGKADKTTDEAFDEHVNNFLRQQSSANRLEKELKNYCHCVRAMAASSKSFYDAVKECYEIDWSGHTEVVKAIESLEILWEDYQRKLLENVMNPLNDYKAQFPEMKSKIAKRGRKLVDYDGARHTVESLSNAKKRDETKILKAQEDMQESKRIFEEMNNELHEELPTLYDNRINFMSSHFHSLFEAETKFEEESAKIKTCLSELSEKLHDESRRGTYTSPRSSSMRRDQDLSVTHRGMSSFYSMDESQSSATNHQVPSEGGQSMDSSKVGATNGEVSDGEASPPASPAPPSPVISSETPPTLETDYEQMKSSSLPKSPTPQAEVVASGGATAAAVAAAAPEETEYEKAGNIDNIYTSPPSNKPVNSDGLPQGVLYQVIATHPYTGEDTDELTFEAGELINVIPFEDPEDMDEGWLMGYKDSNKDKGVFPANFTKRL